METGCFGESSLFKPSSDRANTHEKRLLWSTLFIVTLWFVLSLFVLPSYATRVAANPVTKTPAAVGLAYQDVTVESDGLALPGWWMPADSPIAELMFIHGAGSNRTSHFIDSLNLYKALTDMGISVLSIDLRNHGNAPKTTGHLTMGLDEHRDVLAMAAWLDARQSTHLPKLVMGASMGARRRYTRSPMGSMLMVQSCLIRRYTLPIA